MWWENDDGSLNPAWSVMRVYSEELYGTQFSAAFDFGPNGNELYIGNLYSGPGKSVAAFMSNGLTNGQVTLNVTGGDGSIHVTSAFGVEHDYAVVNGQVTITAPEIPVYVDLQSGQSVQVVPQNWGTDVAQAATVTASATDATSTSTLYKINNGVLENYWYYQNQTVAPWIDTTLQNTQQYPAWVALNWSSDTTLDKVVVYSGTPWSYTGSLLDFDVQYLDDNGNWQTIQSVHEDPKVVQAYSSATRTTADTYYSNADAWVFTFNAISTTQLRVLVHSVTWGGAANGTINAAGGMGAPFPTFTLREIEAFGS
jgi:hypothetical protein